MASDSVVYIIDGNQPIVRLLSYNHESYGLTYTFPEPVLWSSRVLTILLLHRGKNHKLTYNMDDENHPQITNQKKIVSSSFKIN